MGLGRLELRSKQLDTQAAVPFGGAKQQRSHNQPIANTQERHFNSGERINVVESVQVFLATKRKIQLGDKMSGRHGNKGIVSLILDPQDMPFLQNGESVDIVLNPLGVPSRMNVGQVLECLLGFASKYLEENYRVLPFDEIYGKSASRGLVYKKLFETSLKMGYQWIFDPNHPGKNHIFDGRTGESFSQPILVGYSYILKLIHQVDDKMHARSTGPYSLITQQPLGGRSKHGGQRLGEMEVWACEGFGASSLLHEFLTLKSDDIDARNTFLFYLMKRNLYSLPPGVNFVLEDKGELRTEYPHAMSSVAADLQLPRENENGGSNRHRNTYGLIPKKLLSVPTGSFHGYETNRALHVIPRRGKSTKPLAFDERNHAGALPQFERVPESFRVLVHELQSLCLSLYYNPDFRLSYPSLLGWKGIFLLGSLGRKK